MSNTYEIPLINSPQLFSITLSNISYNLQIVWNNIALVWVIDFYDANQVAILTGVPLVTGVDLLAPYTDLGFGGKLFAQTDHDLTAPPTFDNLGITGHLYWVTL